MFGLPFLGPIPAVFVWVALAAWAATFTGLVWNAVGSLREAAPAPVPAAGPQPDPAAEPK
ncbi:hypothetical protein D3C83_184230 [compost metagenome]